MCTSVMMSCVFQGDRGEVGDDGDGSEPKDGLEVRICKYMYVLRKSQTWYFFLGAGFRRAG